MNDNGPSFLQVLKDYKQIRKSPLDYGRHLFEKYGDTVEFKIARYHVKALNTPELHEYVLKTNYQNFIKGKAYERMQPLIGQGLLITNHENWRQNRSIVNPAFRIKKLESYFSEIQTSTFDLFNNFRDGHQYDFHQLMMELTLSVISRVLFHIDLSGRSERVSKAIHDYMEGMENQIFHMSSFQKYIPTPSNRKFLKAVKYLDSIVYDLIKQRRKDYHNRDDLISMLIRAQMNDGAKGITDHYLRDELMTFMVAGHETTANAISWALYHLADNPDVLAKCYEEIDKYKNEELTFKSLDQYEYLEKVINESLRISPAVWITSREVKDHDEFEGIALKKGMIVIVSAYFLHHHPRYWKDPEKFDPERFSKDYNKKAFVPFGVGPRSCIGEHFARIEMRTILIHFLRKYNFKLVQKKIKALATITLRPENGLILEIKERNRDG
jgi:cytochrome P450